MYLSELYGRIGQMLREHGDMEVVRHRSLKIDGIVGTGLDNLVSFSSNNFGVLNDYKQKQIDDKTFEEYKVGQHFVIDIPFN